MIKSFALFVLGLSWLCPATIVNTAWGSEGDPVDTKPSLQQGRWNVAGRTLWEMYGVRPGLLSDKIQEVKKSLLLEFPTESADRKQILLVWQLLKQESFERFYASFIKAIGVKHLHRGAGELHCRIFHAFFELNEGDEATLSWTTSDKLSHLADFLEESDEFSIAFDPATLERMRLLARTLREQGGGWTGELRELSRKAWPFTLAGCATVIALTAYWKGATDYAPPPETRIMQLLHPIPPETEVVTERVTDVATPSQNTLATQSADDAARRAGAEIDQMLKDLR